MLHQNQSSKTETFGPLETALPSFVVDMPDGHFMSVRYGSIEWHFQRGVTTVWLILYLSIYVVFYFQICSIWACLRSMNPRKSDDFLLYFNNFHETLEASTFEPHRYLYINVLLRLTHWSWFLLNRPVQSDFPRTRSASEPYSAVVPQPSFLASLLS